jgi:hypothetical protein
MPQGPPGRYWIIRHPGQDGGIVAKFDLDTNAEIIPDEVADYGDFVIQTVADRSALADKTIDQSGLSESEKELLEFVYPVL